MTDALAAIERLPDDFVRAKGLDYLSWFELFHQLAEPACYLEIGTHSGASLKLATCTSVAIDPVFRLSEDVYGSKPALHLFEETSDEAFANPRFQALNLSVDMAFLDGMHLFEYLLRDFINTEKLMDEGGAIFLHDTAPFDHAMCERKLDHKGGVWTGDVWKLLPILSRYRPELTITHLNCKPTGLTLISGLWNDNPALEDNYDSILAEWTGLELGRYGVRRYYDEHPLVDCEVLIGNLATMLFAE